MKKFLINNKNSIFIGVVLLLLVIIPLSILIIQNKAKMTDNETTGDNTGGNSSSQVLSYIEPGFKSRDNLLTFNKEVFQNYKDWGIYTVGNDYKPYYLSQSLENIGKVISSEAQVKRVEISGDIRSEDPAFIKSIIVLMEKSPFNVIRVSIGANSHSSEYKGIWKSISMDIILDSKDRILVDSKGFHVNTSIFAKNNKDGTWTATYNGSSDNDALVNSVPDQYFIAPFAKSNFYNY